MTGHRSFGLGAVAAAGILAAAAGGAQAAGTYQHVLLISIDGMHAVDLANYISAHPGSTLAGLAATGVRYPNALTTAPSDSFPGLLAPATGGTSKSTGVFYDASFDRTLFAPGSNCLGSPGAATTYAENIDLDPTATNAGGTLGQPLTQIDVNQLPLALTPAGCVPVYPHQFIRVNTIFEVIRSNGGRTAWADKHPAYEILNGPSGTGVQDLFTPEVNSNDPITGQDTTKGFCSIQRNDLLKVQAVLNEIDGLDSTGSTPVGVPTIFGMNFQAVSVGQKLKNGNPSDSPPSCQTLHGGYLDAAGADPNTGLALNLDFVDAQLGRIVTELYNESLLANTLVIIEAKHGQSPIDVTKRVAFDDGPYGATPGVAAYTTDDVALVWLQPSLQKSNYSAAEAYLNSQFATLGITTLLDRTALTKLYNNPFSDSRTPDFVSITQHGLIYTSGSKLAEHGGFSNDDRNVALLLSNPSLSPAVNSAQVETRQIAPTILQALGLNPQALQAVRQENTKALPGL